MFFRAESEIEQWRRREDRRKGAALPLQKVWDLSRLWYGDRMSRSYRGRTMNEARAIFAKLDLTDEFWMLD